MPTVLVTCSSGTLDWNLLASGSNGGCGLDWVQADLIEEQDSESLTTGAGRSWVGAGGDTGTRSKKTLPVSRWFVKTKSQKKGWPQARLFGVDHTKALGVLLSRFEVGPIGKITEDR